MTRATVVFIFMLMWTSGCCHKDIYDDDGLVIIQAETETITCEDGREYIGETYDGVPHGKGQYRWTGGYVYEGEFVYGEFHGKGTIRSYDGCYQFDGTFYDGSIDGRGTIEIGGSIKYHGEWDIGRLVGEGICECHGITFNCNLSLLADQCIETANEARTLSRDCTYQVVDYLDYCEYWKKEP